MDLTKLYNTIIKINLFKGFNINEIENLLKKIRFQIKSYKKNESIFFRGDPIKHIIILLEGTSKGEMHKFNGDTIIIDYMKPNQIIASAFIFGDIQTFPVDLVSMESSKFLFLDKKDFLEVMLDNKRLLTNFIDEISNKGQLLSQRIWFNFINKTINEKVLSYISENQKNGIIMFKPNISELSKRFEVTRPSLSREISLLCNKGILIKIQSNKYRVDLSKL
ncbi:MAG: Crp/Fnr family transcriptional regulator [Leptotrichiaceae bacterium]|nr:Crp/Fnr family transcriptional regulator [Leptotrichiaceae bacterium]MBP6281677.1 Crp/Fnr family transcriptional regulator [Leptotrichiaceae bacterium]MBP7100355.1 Crp/Fnr family transcriptional regulator [Leptotrichiaceae bacterium]MBP7739698.1 Crp/Fnr family transcriptional regulator [Leptotrichiaceae bacterium]